MLPAPSSRRRLCPSQVRHLVDRAVRTALAERKVTAHLLPNDLQDLPYEAPGRKHGTLHSGIGYRAPRVVPYPDDLQQAAEVLNAGKKVAILVGAGALHATDEVIAVAEKLGAGVAKALLGKAALPDDLPWVTGSIGLLGTKPSYDLMTRMRHAADDRLGLPVLRSFCRRKALRAACRSISKADMLSLRYPMEVNLVGDSAETLQALLPLLEQKQDREWREKIEGWTADWWKTLDKRAHEVGKNGVNPQRSVWELSSRVAGQCHRH